jgi:hypothetical protein
VSEPRNDDERLSALLDGRVDERQRRELLAHLVTSDDDYEVFSHAAIVLRQLEEQERAAEPRADAEEPQAHADEARADAPQVRIDEPQARVAEPSVHAAEPQARTDEPQVHADEPQARVAEPSRAGALSDPPSTRTGGWRRSARWAGPLVVALALAAVWIARNSASAADPVRLAVRVDESRRGLPAGWPGPDRWGSVRGPDGATPATPEEATARAVQAGAMLVDLAVAARAGNPDTTRRLATRAASRLEPKSGRGTPLLRIAERPGAPPDSLELQLRKAADRFSDHRGPLQLGAWAEAATLAAHRHDAAFFEDGAKGAMLKRAERLAARDPAARAAVVRVRAAAVDSPDWTELEAALRTLVNELGN